MKDGGGGTWNTRFIILSCIDSVHLLTFMHNGQGCRKPEPRGSRGRDGRGRKIKRLCDPQGPDLQGFHSFKGPKCRDPESTGARVQSCRGHRSTSTWPVWVLRSVVPPRTESTAIKLVLLIGCTHTERSFKRSFSPTTTAHLFSAQQ